MGFSHIFLASHTALARPYNRVNCTPVDLIVSNACQKHQLLGQQGHLRHLHHHDHVLKDISTAPRSCHLLPLPPFARFETLIFEGQQRHGGVQLSCD